MSSSTVLKVGAVHKRKSVSQLSWLICKGVFSVTVKLQPRTEGRSKGESAPLCQLVKLKKQTVAPWDFVKTAGRQGREVGLMNNTFLCSQNERFPAPQQPCIFTRTQQFIKISPKTCNRWHWSQERMKEFWSFMKNSDKNQLYSITSIT